MEKEQVVPHAVLLPGPGLGHVNAMLLLSNALLRVGFHVTLVRFHRAHLANSHQSRALPANVALNILSDGLPFDGSPAYLDLFVTTPTMHDSLHQYLITISPRATCLISDAMMAWAQEVADACGLPRVEFWTASALAYLLLIGSPQLFETLEQSGDLPEFVDLPGLPGFPLEDLGLSTRHSGNDPISQLVLLASRHLPRVDRVLIHSAIELEPSHFQGVAQLSCNAFPVGPLITHQSLTFMPDCISWLDSHAAASVIYVAFGSHAQLSPEEIQELALGLETSGQPFLCVIREELLAKGSELAAGLWDRTHGRGLIVPWAPQVAILGHPAVGGFLTHCGWNSLMESIWMGVPMLGYPKWADQFLNLRLAVDTWGVGFRLVPKGAVLQRIHVECGVKMLWNSEEGKVALSRVQELSKVVRKAVGPGGHSNSSLVKFVEDMKLLKSKQCSEEITDQSEPIEMQPTH